MLAVAAAIPLFSFGLWGIRIHYQIVVLVITQFKVEVKVPMFSTMVIISAIMSVRVQHNALNQISNPFTTLTADFALILLLIGLIISEQNTTVLIMVIPTSSVTVRLDILQV